MTTGAPDRPLLAQEQSELVPRRRLLGLQRGAWQLAFVPGDRAARLRAQLPLVSPGSRVTQSLLPTPPAGRKLRGAVRGTGTHNRHSQETKRSFSLGSFREELAG